MFDLFFKILFKCQDNRKWDGGGGGVNERDTVCF